MRQSRWQKYVVLVGVFFYFPLQAAFLWNDVSLLLPLPTASEISLLVTPQDGEQILPARHFYAFPALLAEINSDIVYQKLLKVIAIRIDPCFVEGKGPLRCHRHIRLIWQPVDIEGESSFTYDASMHAFYEFDDKEWQEIVTAWEQLPKSMAKYLQPHPILQEQGYLGSYWQDLRQIILRFCNERTLHRITSMNSMRGDQMWIFSIFDIVNGQRKEVLIPRIGRTKQGVIMSTGNTQEFTGQINPAPSEDLELSALLQDSLTMKKNEGEVKKLMHRIFEYENPTKHNPGTLDCVSCHVAQSVRLWGQKNFAAWDWANTFKDERYQSSIELSDSFSELRTNHFRIFGYFHTTPIISQRVIHETAEVLRYMNE